MCWNYSKTNLRRQLKYIIVASWMTFHRCVLKMQKQETQEIFLNFCATIILYWSIYFQVKNYDLQYIWVTDNRFDFFTQFFFHNFYSTYNKYIIHQFWHTEKMLEQSKHKSVFCLFSLEFSTFCLLLLCTVRASFQIKYRIYWLGSVAL